MSVLGQLREAVGRLNPAEVREAAERPLAIRLRAGSEAGYDALFRFLLPESMSLERRRRAASLIYLDGEPNRPAKFDISIVERGQVALPNDFIWERGKETTLVREILDRKDAPDLALARWFPAFREEATRRIVNRISVENAMFSVATAIPNIAPYIGLVWTPAEFASDTAFLTLNQIRMIFSLAAASDRAVGYGEQKPEIASMSPGPSGGEPWPANSSARFPSVAVSYRKPRLPLREPGSSEPRSSGSIESGMALRAPNARPPTRTPSIGVRTSRGA